MSGELMIKAWIAVGAAEGLRQAGFVSGEVSERQARKTYGKWFTDAVAEGHIKPTRIGYGKTATRHYLVTDILAYKAKCLTPAELIFNH